jgi:hypothetical protein
VLGVANLAALDLLDQSSVRLARSSLAGEAALARLLAIRATDDVTPAHPVCGGVRIDASSRPVRRIGSPLGWREVA